MVIVLGFIHFLSFPLEKERKKIIGMKVGVWQGVAMPDPSTPCGRAIPETTLRPVAVF
jgi:hypothetical protein